MAPTPLAPSDFEQALAVYAANTELTDLVAGLREAVGHEVSGRGLGAPLAVQAHFFRPSPEIFAAYIVSCGRFILHERNTSGVVWTTAIPLARITRLVERRPSPEQCSLTVEFDADSVTTRTEGEYADGPAVDEAGNPSADRVYGRTVEVSVAQRSFYELSATGQDECASLGRFAARFRSCLAQP